MAGNQRQGQHQFVLNQRAKVEFGRLDQQILGCIVILLSCGVFIRHETEPLVHLDRRRHRLKTTLADQRKFAVNLQVQPWHRG